MLICCFLTPQPAPYGGLNPTLHRYLSLDYLHAIFLNKCISLGAVDMTFSPEVNNNPRIYTVNQNIQYVRCQVTGQSKELRQSPNINHLKHLQKYVVLAGAMKDYCLIDSFLHCKKKV